MKCTFRLTRPKNTNPTSIYLDIIHKGDRLRKSTGVSILPVLWDVKRQLPTNETKKIKKIEVDNPGTRSQLENIEIRLRDYKEGCNEYLKLCIATSTQISAQGLKDHLTRVFDGPTPEIKLTQRVFWLTI